MFPIEVRASTIELYCCVVVFVPALVLAVVVVVGVTNALEAGTKMTDTKIANRTTEDCMLIFLFYLFPVLAWIMPVCSVYALIIMVRPFLDILYSEYSTSIMLDCRRA